MFSLLLGYHKVLSEFYRQETFFLGPAIGLQKKTRYKTLHCFCSVQFNYVSASLLSGQKQKHLRFRHKLPHQTIVKGISFISYKAN